MHDPEARREKIDGLVQRYRAGEFSTEVFTASLKCIRGLTADEIGELVCRHVFVHQASMPYRRGDFRSIGETAMRIVDRIRP